MSAVLQQTKQLYRKVMFVECCGVVSGALLVLLVQNVSAAFAFLLGGLSSFLPQCLFIFWVFFRKNTKNTNKMAAFYRGEGLKWLATIVLMVAVLIGFPNLNVLLFFSGYFLFLICNGLLPIFLTQRT